MSGRTIIQRLRDSLGNGRSDEILIKDVTNEIQAATVEGYISGLGAFSWWKDGTQYVGTCGMTLEEAVAEARHAQSEDAKR